MVSHDAEHGGYNRVWVACNDPSQQSAVELILRATGLEVESQPADGPLPDEPPSVDLVVTSARRVAQFGDYDLPILALAENPHEATAAFDAGADALSTWPQDRGVLGKQVLCLLRSARCAHQLRRLAYEDELTGLASRSYFLRHLDDLINAAQRDHSHFCLLYLDLDTFKAVNDELGHDVGDELLRIVARRLATTLRRADLAARLGGDEFCILATGPHPDGAEVARRCLERVSQPLLLAGRRIRPELSIGIAYYPEDGASSTALLKAADRAMYEAKHTGGHRYAFYRPVLTRHERDGRALTQRLREAFERGAFLLHYQPQVNLLDGRTRAVEALLRWPNQSRLTRAADFIAVTERSGLIRTLGLWVLEQACRQAAQWAAETGDQTFVLSVNLSTVHLHEQDLAERIETILLNTRWPPQRLELEIREEALHNDRLNHLGRLRAMGIRLAVDDYGSGCASLSALSKFPVDSLKLDGHWVRGLEQDPQAAVLVGTLLGMARSLELGLTAEQVESERAAQILAALGCDAAQGHYFSAPVPPDRIPKLLDHTWPEAAPRTGADPYQRDPKTGPGG